MAERSHRVRPIMPSQAPRRTRIPVDPAARSSRSCWSPPWSAALGGIAVCPVAPSGRRTSDAGRRSPTSVPAPGGVVVVGRRVGDLRHEDEQPVPLGSDRSRGLLRGVGPPQQCAVVTVDRVLPAPWGAGHRDSGGDRDPLRRTWCAGARAVHPPAGAVALVGGGGEHRRCRSRWSPCSTPSWRDCRSP